MRREGDCDTLKRARVRGLGRTEEDVEAVGEPEQRMGPGERVGQR